jgi:hypothetical protein
VLPTAVEPRAPQVFALLVADPSVARRQELLLLVSLLRVVVIIAVVVAVVVASFVLIVMAPLHQVRILVPVKDVAGDDVARDGVVVVVLSHGFFGLSSRYGCVSYVLGSFDVGFVVVAC